MMRVYERSQMTVASADRLIRNVQPISRCKSRNPGGTPNPTMFFEDGTEITHGPAKFPPGALQKSLI